MQEGDMREMGCNCFVLLAREGRVGGGIGARAHPAVVEPPSEPLATPHPAEEERCNYGQGGRHSTARHPCGEQAA